MEQIRQSEIEGVLDLFLIGFEDIHGAIEMMQGQALGSLNADVLSQPLFITVELGTRGARSVGYHGKEGPFDGKIDFAATELIRNDVGDAQSLPELNNRRRVSETQGKALPNPKAI